MTNVFIGVLSLRMWLFEFSICLCVFHNAGFGQVLQVFYFLFVRFQTRAWRSELSMTWTQAMAR
jgi:hypothetical protein